MKSEGFTGINKYKRKIIKQDNIYLHIQMGYLQTVLNWKQVQHENLVFMPAIYGKLQLQK